MIQFDQVTKRYPGGNEALKNLSFNIDTGEMVFLAGHSGAGKSTLLKLVAGIERATAGGVIVNGQNLSKLRSSQIPYVRQHIGLVFQDHKILFDRSVFDNVMLPLDIIGFDRRDAAKRVRAALDKVGLLSKEKPCRSACPAASSSACASPAPWCIAPAFCWQTSHRQPTAPMRWTSWNCSNPSTKSASPC